MWKKDLDKVKELHEKYNFKGPLLDAGGLEKPCIADYDISAEKAHRFNLILAGENRNIVVPYSEQGDRYLNITRPWEFIDSQYTIENPENDGLTIEKLHTKYNNFFNTVIIVSVFEHVNDPFECAEQLKKSVAKGGYVFNSAPFQFPRHDEVDNWRFSPKALEIVHKKAGFEIIESGTHIEYTVSDGIGNLHNRDELQTIIGSYVLARFPEND